ncbi:MAG: GDSL-type esterase/lipase family protein, partial [Polyangiaceae bacterium]
RTSRNPGQIEPEWRSSEVGSAPSAPVPLKQRFVVAAMGDSLSDPRASGGKYLEYLKERCPKSQFDSYGIAGKLVANMRARFGHDVLGVGRGPEEPAPKYTHVIIFGGVNDLGSDKIAHRPVERIEEDLAAMYEMAKSSGIRVIAMTIAPWSSCVEFYTEARGKKTSEINTWILSQPAAGTIDHVIDAHSLLACGDPDQLCPRFENRWVRDGLHFNTEGHEVLGRALYENVFSSCE